MWRGFSLPKNRRSKNLPMAKTRTKLRGMTIYCEATHPKSPDGCYEHPDHEGAHRGIRSGYGCDYSEFFWGDEVEVSPAFTPSEVGILLTCLQPVTAFFPELVKKLEGMKQ